MDLPFNPKPPTIMHIDLNSCFASIEQQSNPLLRGKPIAVAAYATGSGCILAPSREAKVLGIKVGMRVRDAKLIYPNLIVMEPDPQKYKVVHHQLKELLSQYTSKIAPKSIDEFVLDFEGFPSYRLGLSNVASDIKAQIKSQIGDWLTVSIGIAPNHFLAKTASNLHKPDGLDSIDINNFQQVYEKLQLMDICGIKTKNSIRLNQSGIFTVMDFYRASVAQLRSAFNSINGYYWYLRLRAWQIDDVEFSQKSFGHSYALPKPLSTPDELAPILQKLVHKTGLRLRRHGYKARGVHLSIVFRDHNFWHQGHSLPFDIFDSRDIYSRVFSLLLHCPYRGPVREIAVSVFNLSSIDTFQMDFFADSQKSQRLSQAMDDINTKWGDFVITPARMLGTDSIMPERISFGSVK